MAIVTVEKNTYTAGPLYQWDQNQTLEIYGLSLASVPEIHFTNAAMDRAIVQQATMDAAGVIRATVPNSLLQQAMRVVAYIGTYSGGTFETTHKLEVPVRARPQPTDYKLVDDSEVYSFNALENRVVNALAACAVADQKYNTANTALGEAKTAYENAKSDVEKAVEKSVDTAMGIIEPTLLSDETKATYGLSQEAVPDDAFKLLRQIIPTGSVFWLASQDAPYGYLVCDGSEVTKAEYPALYAVIGDTFGEGTDTTFKLPDLRAKFVRGAGTNNGYSAVFGETQEATAEAVATLNAPDNCDKSESYTTGDFADGGSSSSSFSKKKYYYRPYNIALTPIIKYL